MEQYMSFKSFIISLTLIFTLASDAGTIIYKTSSKDEEHILPKVKIVSIAQRTITIKHGGGVRTIPLSYLIGYYDTDIEAGSFEDNTCDYSVTVRKIDMPETGYEIKKTKKSKKRTTAECEIEFSVNKKLEKGKSKSIRMPYFYLFVLTTSSESYGRRPVYTYYYPDEAKVSSKTYDEAKIIEAVTAMKRPRLYKNNSTPRLGKGHKSLSYTSGYKPIKISLKKIRGRRIIAYHLEVWGKKKKILEKNWRDSSYKTSDIGKNWWKRY
jgi:hypothetical protein